MDQLVVNKKLGGLTMCHGEGVGVADGIAVGDGEIKLPTGMAIPISGAGLGGLLESTRRLLEQPQAPTARVRASERIAISEMRGNDGLETDA